MFKEAALIKYSKKNNNVYHFKVNKAFIYTLNIQVIIFRIFQFE